MTHRFANARDCLLLGELNHQLIRDEGHRNPLNALQLAERMEGWIASEYRALIFENEAEIVGYVLYRESVDEIYLRQLFVVRNKRRQGFGRSIVALLRDKIWSAQKRLTVDVLVTNHAALQFWRALGYRDYALTLEILP